MILLTADKPDEVGDWTKTPAVSDNPPWRQASSPHYPCHAWSEIPKEKNNYSVNNNIIYIST